MFFKFVPKKIQGRLIIRNLVLFRKNRSFADLKQIIEILNKNIRFHIRGFFGSKFF